MSSKKIVLETLTIIFGLVLLISPVTSYGGEGCSIEVTDDTHLAPAAELATTVGYPDIIELENSKVKVTSIPNRGRLLFDYRLKSTNNSLLYTNKNPLPLKTGDDFYLEFGGFYSSYPWNDRANQPYDLQYKIVEDNQGQCAIKIYKHGADLTFDFEVVLTLESNSRAAELKFKFTNTKDTAKTLDFSTVFIAAPGDSKNRNYKVGFPEEVNQIRIVKSEENWMGEPGKEVSWPSPWKEWGEYQGSGKYSVSLANLKKRFVKVSNRESDEFIQLRWGSKAEFPEVKVESWGPKYEDIMGAYPGFAISLDSNPISFSPSGSKTFVMELIAGKGEV